MEVDDEPPARGGARDVVVDGHPRGGVREQEVDLDPGDAPAGPAVEQPRALRRVAQRAPGASTAGAGRRAPSRSARAAATSASAPALVEQHVLPAVRGGEAMYARCRAASPGLSGPTTTTTRRGPDGSTAGRGSATGARARWRGPSRTTVARSPTIATRQGVVRGTGAPSGSTTWRRPRPRVARIARPLRGSARSRSAARRCRRRCRAAPGSRSRRRRTSRGAGVVVALVVGPVALEPGAGARRRVPGGRVAAGAGLAEARRRRRRRGSRPRVRGRERERQPRRRQRMAAALARGRCEPLVTVARAACGAAAPARPSGV